jgi:hypothetical protein
MPDFVISLVRLRHDVGAVHVELERRRFERNVIWQNAFRVYDEPNVLASSQRGHVYMGLSADRDATDLADCQKQAAGAGSDVACVYDVDAERLVIGGWEEELLDTQVRLPVPFWENAIAVATAISSVAKISLVRYIVFSFAEMIGYRVLLSSSYNSAHLPSPCQLISFNI